jgi:hypothetical protein
MIYVISISIFIAVFVAIVLPERTMRRRDNFWKWVGDLPARVRVVYSVLAVPIHLWDRAIIPLVIGFWQILLELPETMSDGKAQGLDEATTSQIWPVFYD